VISAEMGMPPPYRGGIYHRRGMIVLHELSTYRNAEDNNKTRALFERLIAACGEQG
jgi:hypothetical protein